MDALEKLRAQFAATGEKLSALFGSEKDDSFRGSIGNIYQTALGQDVYPTVEAKAAKLLYFVAKNHSFNDGNKRTAAALFLYFLEQNNALYRENGKSGFTRTRCLP